MQKDQTPDPGPDFAHLERVLSLGEIERAVQVGRAVSLVRWVLEAGPQPLHSTFPNDFSALACFARAKRQVQAAIMLAFTGYYSEVGTVLRSAYESATLGRFLARQPQEAERWLRKKRWFPDKEVRQWFGDPEKVYLTQYRNLSAASHPTAESCLPLVDFEAERFRLRLESEFDERVFSSLLDQIAVMALFLCFAVQNAAISREALPPEWRKELSDLEEDVLPGGDWTHLQSNWEEERRKFSRFLGRVQRATDLENRIKESPMSWENLTRKAGKNDD